MLPDLDDVPAFMYCHEPMIPEHAPRSEDNLSDELYFLSETLKENMICPSITRPNTPEPPREASHASQTAVTTVTQAEELVDISPDYITVFNSARRCLLRLHTDDTIELSDEFVDMIRKELEKYDLTVARKSAIEQMTKRTEMTKRRRTDASFDSEGPTNGELLDHILRQAVAYS